MHCTLSHLVDRSQAYRHLYMGPSSVHDDPGTVRSGRRPSITDIYALGFHIQPEMIATVCCFVRRYYSGLRVTLTDLIATAPLSSRRTWEDIDNNFNLRQLWLNIVEPFNTSNAFRKKILTWWHKCVSILSDAVH